MPTGPAAVVGGQCTPPHVPPVMGPGIGAPTVLIGGRPAWRTNLDVHACTLPVAPPAPAPHGPEICYFGSLSVMIGGQMATRVGDILTGMAGGPPNPITMGVPTVIIGDIGFGMAGPPAVAAISAGMAQLQVDWPTLTPDQRRLRLQDIINGPLGAIGLPPQSVAGSPDFDPGSAEYDFGTDTLTVSQDQLDSPTLSADDADELARTIHHEGRHAEQWYRMAQTRAGDGESAADIQRDMGVTPAMARAAAADPLTDTSPERNLGQASYDSVYGDRADYREDVLDDIDARDAEYRALPEEQDAYNTEDLLP